MITRSKGDQAPDRQEGRGRKEAASCAEALPASNTGILSDERAETPKSRGAAGSGEKTRCFQGSAMQSRRSRLYFP